MDNNDFLDLIQGRAKKASTFVEDAGKEATRQFHILNGVRLTLIAASAVTSMALGLTLGLTLGRRG